MKKERESRGRTKREKASKGAGKRPQKPVKLRVTGDTEILDFDLPEEDGEEPGGGSAGAVPSQKAEIPEKKEENGRRKESKSAVKAYGEKMPKEPVSLSEETLELLELDEILASSAPEGASDRKAPQKKGTASASGREPGRELPRSKKAVSASGRKSDREASRGKRAAYGKRGRKKKRGGYEFGVMDAVIALTGVLVVVVAAVAFSLYRGASDVEDQVAAMAEVGEKLETIGYAGEGVLVAVADARLAAGELDGAERSEEPDGGNGGYEEKELVSKVSVGLKLSSVQRDLKIKFTNKESGKLIGNQAFTVKIEGPETVTKTDEDRDGIIYINALKAGEYTVTITAPDEVNGAQAAGIKGLITVRDTIEYKKIDVTDEVKKESEINAAKEDTAVALPVESVMTDTVEWVESTKTPVGSGSISYEQVKKADIPEPSAAAMLDRIWAADGKEGAYVVQDTVKLPWNAAFHRTETAGTLEKGVWFTKEDNIAPAAEVGVEEVEQEQPADQELEVTDVSIEGVGDYEVGDSITLRAAVTTNGAGTLSESDYVWSGDVSGTGQSLTFRAEKEGTMQVRLTVKDMSVSTSFYVAGKESPPEEKPVVEVERITVSADAAQAEVGKSVGVSAEVVMSDGSSFPGTLNWSADGGEVVSTDKNKASVTADRAGKVTVSAEADGKMGSVQIEFIQREVSAQKVTVAMEAPGSMNVGEEKTLKCTAGGDVASVKWSVSDAKIATIEESSGKVKAVAPGKVTVKVTVTGKGGDSAEARGELTVNAAKPGEIKLEPSGISMKTGEKKTVKAILTDTDLKAVEWKSSDESIVKIVESKDDSCTFQALKQGNTTLTATGKENGDKKAVCEITVVLADGTALLKDKAGNQLYYKSGEEYKEATAADYYKYDVFYRKKDTTQYFYTGWQNIDGKRYYFDKNGVPVTGNQIIQGMQYSFNGDGTLKVNGIMGIDISKHNGSIDWNAVKNAGVNYVIIRCGYRGSATGVLVEDERFRANIQGAQAAGLKVGIYFFSQAVTEREALEEASLTIDLIRKYKITYPVYMDVEAANGRADGLDAGTRTQLIRTFCETLRASGYTAGVYANKTWLGSKMNAGALGNYKIWLAQYAATPTYGGRYEMWQYSSRGKIAGISTNVDLNISYMSY